MNTMLSSGSKKILSWTSSILPSMHTKACQMFFVVPDDTTLLIQSGVLVCRHGKLYERNVSQRKSRTIPMSGIVVSTYDQFGSELDPEPEPEFELSAIRDGATTRVYPVRSGS